MPFVNAETKLPSLVIAYLESARSTVSLPDSTTLPFVELQASTEISRPSVCVWCEGFTAPHPRVQRLSLRIELRTHARDTAFATENEYLAAIRRALTDAADVNAYFTALDESARTGWRITGWLVTEGAIEVDPATQTRVRITTLQVRCQATETAGHS